MGKVAMRKRLRLLVGAALFALLAAVMVMDYLVIDRDIPKRLPPDPEPVPETPSPEFLARGQLIDREHFEKIKEGMSRAEVESILGGPPGDFTTRPMVF